MSRWRRSRWGVDEETGGSSGGGGLPPAPPPAPLTTFQSYRWIGDQGGTSGNYVTANGESLAGVSGTLNEGTEHRVARAGTINRVTWTAQNARSGSTGVELFLNGSSVRSLSAPAGLDGVLEISPPLAVVAGDRIAFQLNNGGTQNMGRTAWFAFVEAEEAGYLLTWGGAPSGANAFFVVNCRANTATSLGVANEIAAYTILRHAFLGNLRWNSAATFSSTGFNLYVNGVVVATLSLSGATGNYDASAIEVFPGDRVAIRYNTGTIGSTIWNLEVKDPQGGVLWFAGNPTITTQDFLEPHARPDVAPTGAVTATYTKWIAPYDVELTIFGHNVQVPAANTTWRVLREGATALDVVTPADQVGVIPVTTLLFNEGQQVELRYLSGTDPNQGSYMIAWRPQAQAAATLDDPTYYYQVLQWGGDVAGTATRRLFVNGSLEDLPTVTTNTSRVELVVPRPGVLVGFTFNCETAVGGSVFTIERNGSVVGTITLPATAEGFAPMNAATSLAAGDRLVIYYSSGTSPGDLAVWAILRVALPAGYLVHFAGNPSGTGVYFFHSCEPGLAISATVLDQRNEWVVIRRGNLVKITWSTATGATDTALKFVRNGVVIGSAFLLTAAQGHATLGSPIALEEGDVLALEYDAGTNPGISNFVLEIEEPEPTGFMLRFAGNMNAGQFFRPTAQVSTGVSGADRFTRLPVPVACWVTRVGFHFQNALAPAHTMRTWKANVEVQAATAVMQRQVAPLTPVVYSRAERLELELVVPTGTLPSQAAAWVWCTPIELAAPVPLPWTPEQAPGLKVYLDADAYPNTITEDANGVSAWANRMALAPTSFVQGTNAAKPVAEAAVSNGRRGIRFNRNQQADLTTTDYLEATTPVPTLPYTFVVVCRNTDDASEHIALGHALFSSSPQSGIGMAIGADGVPARNPELVLTHGGSATIVRVTNAWAVGDLLVMVAVFEAGRRSLVANGDLAGDVSDTTSFTPSTPDVLTIGVLRTTGINNSPYHGFVLAVLAYSLPLSLQNQANAAIWAASRFSGAAALLLEQFNWLWVNFDASDAGSITADGNGVSQWNNKAPGATGPLSVTQTDNALKPSVASAAINGLDAIYFGGGNRTLRNTTTVPWTDSLYHWFVVVRPEVQNTHDWLALHEYANANVADTWRLRSTNAGQARFDAHDATHADSNGDFPTTVNADPFAPGETVILEAVHGGFTDRKVYLDGDEAGVAASVVDVQPTTVSSLWLGSFYSNSGATLQGPAQGWLCQIVGFRTNLGPSARAYVRALLKAKWATR